VLDKREMEFLFPKDYFCGFDTGTGSGCGKGKIRLRDAALRAGM
jgi:hypothetical protein